jgi:hypothetical protein
MPKATIDEHKRPRTRQYDVYDDSLHATMQPESQSFRVQCGTKSNLGGGIPASNLTHDFRAGQWPTIRVASTILHERAPLLLGDQAGFMIPVCVE